MVAQLNKNQGIYTSQTAEALKTASNKMKTLQKCSNAGLRIPRTIFINSSFNIDFIISKLGLPFVCKTSTGSQGAGVSVFGYKKNRCKCSLHSVEK
ncbi:MAG: hypothetical protein U9Q83_07780 [Bacteroidota bacterium]|nr:hypothetical protein [Bacteroidota bacterium]